MQWDQWEEPNNSLPHNIFWSFIFQKSLSTDLTHILSNPSHKNIIMVIKHNIFCPGVYSPELFQCQICISTCVNILTSTTAWNSSKLVEKKQMPRSTYNLKNKSLGLAAKEVFTAGVWSKELVYRPRTQLSSMLSTLTHLSAQLHMLKLVPVLTMVLYLTYRFLLICDLQMPTHLKPLKFSPPHVSF